MKILFLITLMLTGCDMMVESQKATSKIEKPSTLYPMIWDENECHPIEKQTKLIANFQKLKSEMTSDLVVKLLEFKPSSYFPVPSKQPTPPINFYRMSYNLVCTDHRVSYIDLIFSSDEKLKTIYASKGINILNLKLDKSITLTQNF